MSLLSKELSALGPLFQIVPSTPIQQSGQATVQLCLANPLRWGVIFGPPISPSTNIVIAPTADMILAGGGFLLATGSGLGSGTAEVAAYWFRRHGPLAQSAWFGGQGNGSPPAANVTWSVVEILLVPG